ncbi:MAG: four helix bundle protein [Caulobacteraceae bacterium]|nr:four helix bundle protein [Caulobacteraceae bacterium]
MAEINSYRDLKVWQRAMDIAVLVYELTRSFPRDEQYGLTSQVRRSIVSVAANIAEGYGRSTKPAYLSFLRISQGSLKETETHLILASRLSICDEEVVTGILSQTDELGRMLRGLIVSLEARPSH